MHQKLLTNGLITTTTNQSDEFIRIVRKLDIMLRRKSLVDKLKKLYSHDIDELTGQNEVYVEEFEQLEIRIKKNEHKNDIA